VQEGRQRFLRAVLGQPTECARFEMTDVAQRPLEREECGAEHVRSEVGQGGGVLVTGTSERDDPCGVVSVSHLGPPVSSASFLRAGSAVDD
jgi:hypothetical protein